MHTSIRREGEVHGDKEMDKYHIYEEVGAGQHSQVFKGREKMDIEYVAIKRIEKCMIESVVKEVQVRGGETRAGRDRPP